MKHFINLKDIPPKDLRKIITDAKKRKAERKNLSNLKIDKKEPLKDKLLIQMFEKSSLRTRLSFYLAIKQLGGSTLTLRPDELHLSKGGESIKDTAKILSNFGNAFMLRTDDDKKLKEFREFISIPIINGLSPSSHPTQILSDVFTVEEIKKKPITKLNISWIGDSNNVLNSLKKGGLYLFQFIEKDLIYSKNKKFNYYFDIKNLNRSFAEKNNPVKFFNSKYFEKLIKNNSFKLVGKKFVIESYGIREKKVRINKYLLCKK